MVFDVFFKSNIAAVGGKYENKKHRLWQLWFIRSDTSYIWQQHKKVYTKDNCNLDELKKDLSLIFKSNIKELKDITNKKIMRDNIILKGGI